MNHHPVFTRFSRVPVTGTGSHVFDFLGIATNVEYKKGWDRHSIKAGANYIADYPPLNEHYFDWIALLESVSASSNKFRMAELGAGWAPWLVRGGVAAKQKFPDIELELVAVEADETHYKWILDHLLDNKLNASNFKIIRGCISVESGVIKFPKISNPDEDYGASTRQVNKNSEFVEVTAISIEQVLNHFSGPLDFLHMDIQGAEYDVLPSSMNLLSANVKSVMVGTHISIEKHNDLHSLFLAHDWEPVMIFPRNSEVQTEFGLVNFGDGFQYWRNKKFKINSD